MEDKVALVLLICKNTSLLDERVLTYPLLHRWHLRCP